MSCKRFANQSGCHPRKWPAQRRHVTAAFAAAVVLLTASPEALAGPTGPSTARSLNTISKLSVEEPGDKTVIRLVGSAKPMFSVFKLEHPPRLTLDLANSRLRDVSSLLDVNSWAVSQIATSEFRTDSTTIGRVMINFRRQAHYNVRTEQHDLVVEIMPHERRPKDAAVHAEAEAKRLRETADRHARELERARGRAARHTAALRKAEQATERLSKDLETAQRRTRDQKAAVTQLEQQLRDARAQASAAQTGSKTEATNRLKRAEVALRRAQVEARESSRERARIENQLAEARRVVARASKAQAAAERARARAESARAEAEKQRAAEMSRRRVAEEAHKEAAHRAAALTNVVAKMRVRNKALADAARRAKTLERALAEAKKQEQARRRAILSAGEQMKKSGQQAALARLETKRANRQIEQAQRRAKALERELEGTRRKLANEKQSTSAALARVAKLKNEAQKARERVAQQREGKARAQAKQALRSAERKLRRAEAMQRKTNRQRQKIGDEMERLSARLAETVARRESEEARRGAAEQARRDEETRLRQVRAARAEADQARSDAKRELNRLQKELATARKAVARASSTKQRLEQGLAVRDIRFVDHADRSEIHIEGAGPVEHSVDRDAGDLVLSLKGISLPRALRRTMDASAFAGPVQAVSSYSAAPSELKDPSRGPVTRLRLRLRSEAPQRVRRAGDTLVWELIKPQRVAASGAPQKAQKKTVASEGSTAYSFESVKVASSRGRTRRSRGGSSKRYQGRRIDLDFKDADIHNILRLLSEVGDVNIVTSDAVSGAVTIRMKNVPWDQALDVILRAKSLGQVREGNLVRVAPVADLEKEREAEIARQKQMMLLQPLETRLVPLSYAQASDVLGKVQYTLSPRGKVTYDERTNTVIARDVAANLNVLEGMIRNLDSQTPQVVIEARIVEARTNYTKQIGVQWGGSFTASSATGNSTGLVFPNQLGIGGGTDDSSQPTQGLLLGQAASPNFAVNMPASTGLNSGGALGLTLGSVSGVFNVNLRLSAAESTGDIRIISAPKVTTLDNVEAQIEQGVTIPFSQVSANGVQTTFKDAKLSLKVKPHVTADGSIIMKVSVERNEPDFVNTGPRGDPTILKKQAQTEMLVKDGDTAVIGGIYTTRDGRSWQKVPWFAEIPIIGWLFKTRRDTSDREEVLVFITPRIVNRAQSIGP